MQQQEIEPHLEAATRFVNEAVTADALVRHLAESCLAEVREHFQHYLDRPLTETETGECYQKYESIDASLQSRYGKIECHLLINADEDRGTEDAPYTVIDKPDLLMRAIALNLRQAGVLEREKFKTEASQAAAGDQPRRQIKRITDDAYYVKEQVAGQSHARYRSLHPADLHSFNLSKERAGKILKSTLMSTTDRDQLCLLDQSSVWDLITDPHAGFPEDASQWLGALAHFAVKRYRQANPTANEFLLLKAQGKIAGQDPLHQQRDLVTLMEMGEESLAVRVASALTTFDWCEEESKDTLLHWAVRKGCDKVLKELASKMNVNVTNAEKATPLMVAAERVDAAVCVEALLQKGANTDLADKDGMTALMTAAKHGVDASVCALLNHDANADLQDRHGWNALHLAAMSGHPFIAERLANAVGDVNQTGGPYGETALMAAARHDHVEVVRKLLHSSPNLNLTNEEGCSAFHSAARCGQIEILEELGPHMTSVDEPTPLREMTALMLAVENGHADAVRALMNFRLDLRRKNRGGFNAIHIAALHGQATILQLLKDRFPDNEIVNDFNNDHETPLMLAARSGQADAVRWLLANKADGSLRNEMGEKAFHLAAACGHSDIVRILRSSMVDLDELSGHGDTALMLAAAHGYTDTVRMLLTLGSNVQTPCENGWTALHCAVSKSRVEVAEVLIDAKADVNAVTQNKTTPMLLAILEQCQPMIQLLTRKGGKLLHLNTPDENGRTHLMRAVSDERWSDFDALVEAGAWMAAAELDSPEEDIDLLASDDPFSWLLE
ncbi:MAG TPA: ankyrin repeat domain-containing protein [Burkholderiaceae bacterium]|nr:ankyrin repeat domain-containing protein [Burkholderiaceae bacterium]